MNDLTGTRSETDLNRSALESPLPIENNQGDVNPNNLNLNIDLNDSHVASSSVSMAQVGPSPATSMSSSISAAGPTATMTITRSDEPIIYPLILRPRPTVHWWVSFMNLNHLFCLFLPFLSPQTRVTCGYPNIYIYIYETWKWNENVTT